MPVAELESVRRHSFLVKSASQILLACVLAVVVVCPARADSASVHSASTTKLRHRLFGRWTRQKKGTDAQGACLISIAVEFRADGYFRYTQTFHALDHLHPTWDFLVDGGTWKLRDGVLVQHWTGNGEHPGGYTSRSAVLYLSAGRLRYVEGADGAVSYHRASRTVRLAVPPNHALQRTEAGRTSFLQSTSSFASLRR